MEEKKELDISVSNYNNTFHLGVTNFEEFKSLIETANVQMEALNKTIYKLKNFNIDIKLSI